MDYFSKIDNAQAILDGDFSGSKEPKIKATLSSCYKEIQNWSNIKEQNLNPEILERTKELLLSGKSTPSQEIGLINRVGKDYNPTQNTTTIGEENSGETIRVIKNNYKEFKSSFTNDISFSKLGLFFNKGSFVNFCKKVSSFSNLITSTKLSF